MAKSDRGFASMDPKKQKEIASKGGKAVSKNHEHMSEIGKKGGKIISQNREHMSEIGKKGGKTKKNKNKISAPKKNESETANKEKESLL